MSSRAVIDLAPRFQPNFRDWFFDCKAHGLDVIITSTFRSIAEQEELYAQGRTTPGKIVTKAHGGESAHNYGLALDFLPMFHGKPLWATTYPEWKMAGDLAPKHGLEWGGAWKKFKDLPHIQVPDWRTYI